MSFEITCMSAENQNPYKNPDCQLLLRNGMVQGCLGGSVVKRLPLPQGVILESWDRVLHGAPCLKGDPLLWSVWVTPKDPGVVIHGAPFILRRSQLRI